jgi:4-amino-4-deoxy-L-arabinose transferase-like glycosyltransferase
VVPPPLERLAVVLLLALFVGLAATSVRGSSATADEYAHLPAGCAYLRHGSLDLYAKSPPLVRYALALPALARGAAVPPPQMPTAGAGWDPWRYGDAFLEANAGPRGLGRYPGLLGAARGTGLALGAALLLVIYLWSRRLHGPAGGLISLGLGALCPTLLAHAPLATVDVGGALFFVLAAWLCRRALLRPGAARWAAAGAGVGAAVAAKFTGLLLLPLVVVWAAWARRRLPDRRTPARRSALHAAAFAAAALAVVQAAYQLDRPVTRLGGHAFQSAAGRAARSLLPAWTPLPLPAAMVAGLDGQALDLEQAEMPNYLNGRWSRRGWWYYHPEALLLKTPLGLWGLGLLLAGLALRRRPGSPPGDDARLSSWIAATAAGAVLVASLPVRLDIGVRYLLPALPFLHLLLGAAAPAAARAGRAARAALGVLLVAYAGESLHAYPRYLPFFNRLAGGPDGGWRYLLSSNNDWGQDLGRLREWLDRQGVSGPIGLAYFGHVDPARYGIDYEIAPDAPRPGLHAVSLNLLLGMPYVVVDHGRWVLLGDDLTRPQQRYAWLRHRTPVARIGGTIWVYRIDPDDGAPGG